MNTPDQAAILATRNAFFKDPSVNLTHMRETIAKSWIRSWKHKINPHRTDFGRLDSENFLASHVTKERPILSSYIFSCIESLYTSNDFSSMVLVLTDSSGRIINLYGSNPDIAKLSDIGLAEECTLRESSAGTNAIGTSAKWRFNDIIGTSPALMESMNLARIARKTNCTVLITGKSGTGKELFARRSTTTANAQMAPLLPLTAVQSQKN